MSVVRENAVAAIFRYFFADAIEPVVYSLPWKGDSFQMNAAVYPTVPDSRWRNPKDFFPLLNGTGPTRFVAHG
jgi:hypothetical protein